MKHIVNFSGGKDSTAMLLKMLEMGCQIDEICYIDTGKDFPQMYRHIEKVNNYIKEKYNKEITILYPKYTFDYLMFEKEKTKGNSIGQKGYGWARQISRWCTSDLKNKTANAYLKQYKKEGCINYIGIAYDEPKRIKSDKKYPLVEWKMTEADCLQYCYDKGFDWEGLYEHFDRLSCWCCPLKNLKELRVLYHHYPELWEQLKDMDKRANNSFRRDYSVEELEEKFRIEDEISNWLDKPLSECYNNNGDNIENKH